VVEAKRVEEAVVLLQYQLTQHQLLRRLLLMKHRQLGLMRLQQTIQR
jgi:hypothetical protein